MSAPTLMRHQEEAVRFQRDKSAAYLCCDRGTGKTAMVLVDLEARVASGEVKRALYVAPLSTLENVRREATRFTKLLEPQILWGTRGERAKMILEPKRANLDIINFDALRIMGPELLGASYDAVIADEATRIKDRRTQVARAITILGRRAKYRRCLSGMPFTEGVEDLWSQFYFLDPAVLGSNFWAFRNRYCSMREAINPRTGKVYSRIVSYRHVEELLLRISPIAFRVSKEECLDLPPKVYQVLRIPLLEEQARHYARVERELVTSIGEHDISHVSALAKISKLRQIASGFIYDDEREPVLVPSGKYEELKDLLSEILWDRKKVVVFTSFRAEPPLVREVVGSLAKPAGCFLLPDNPSERQACVDEWSAFEGPAALVANAQSGGIGLNLTAADTAIFISNDWKPEPRVQAEDRIHRIGSEVHHKVTIIDIVTRGTIEEDILDALQNKRDFVEEFMQKLKAGNGGAGIEFF